MMTTAIELVSYKLKGSATQGQLAKTHDKVNQFLQAQDGFLYRSLSQDEDGVLYDMVYWRDIAAAKTAAEAFCQSQAGEMLMALTDMDTVKLRHMPALTEAMSAECSTEA